MITATAQMKVKLRVSPVWYPQITHQTKERQEPGAGSGDRSIGRRKILFFLRLPAVPAPSLSV
jgi:hypothetical protein